jgi:short-subunit dehydrogenase
LSRTKSELEETAAECKKFGVKTIVLPVDMTNEEQVNEAVKKVSPLLSIVDSRSRKRWAQ